MNLIIAFLTGLTTGGLGCLAVQSGLLATALAHQLELDNQSSVSPGNYAVKQNNQHQIIRPLLLFLLAKLITYTLFGFLLGAFGAVLQLTPLLRAILMIAIGIFMLGNGLRMLKVHTIFRYFVIEPPTFFTRFIRRTSNNNTSLFTPLFLGALTVLLPCGIAQSMMAAAMGTGDPFQGAAILFSFTLGTIPIFFGVAFFATRLGVVLEKYLTRITAVILIVLGLIPLDYGLNLAGSPISFTKVFNRILPSTNSATLNDQVGIVDSKSGYIINVIKHGYAPSILHLEANKPDTIIWVTNGVKTCALSIVIPKLDYEKTFPLTGRVTLVIPAQKKGAVIEYSCSMGMYHGQLVFDLKMVR